MKDEIKNTAFEAFEGRIVHPSIDFTDGVLTLGFRYRTKSMKEEQVFLISSGGTTQIITDDSFQMDGHTYHIDKKRGGKLMMTLDERWGIDRAEVFVKQQTSLESRGKATNTLVEQHATEARRYIGFESEIDSYIYSAWIIGTYFHRIFHAYPFLHIKAPKGSGKSQCLNYMAQLCFNAVKARPSVAALGDTVDALRGTYLIDQADSLTRLGQEELLDILADSYKRSGGKRRVVNFDKGQRGVLEFETYSPKAFASIKELPEDLRDRCYLISLIRNSNGFPDPGDPYLDQSWKEHRAALYEALIGEYSLVDATYQYKLVQYRQSKAITGRKLELWLPLEVILEHFGAGDKIEEAKQRFFTQYGYAEYEPTELEGEVIITILAKFNDGSEITLSPKEISEGIDISFFRSNSDPKQRAVAVGWTIKKFNLSSGKTRSGSGISYRFDKVKVEVVKASYFGGSDILPTSSTLPEAEAQDRADSGAGDEV